MKEKMYKRSDDDDPKSKLILGLLIGGGAVLGVRAVGVCWGLGRRGRR